MIYLWKEIMLDGRWWCLTVGWFNMMVPFGLLCVTNIILWHGQLLGIQFYVKNSNKTEKKKKKQQNNIHHWKQEPTVVRNQRFV